MYKGIGASAGIGIGKIVKIKEEELNYTKQSIEDTEAEKKRLSDAIEVFIEKTQKMVESMKVTAGEQEAEILEGHIMMIQDPAISEQIEAKIDGEKINAEAAVEEAAAIATEVEDVTELLNVEVLEVEIGYGLIPLADESSGGDLLQRIA